MDLLIPGILLADIEGFFGIVFFLIAFVGWVINIVSQNKSAEQKKRDVARRGPVAQQRGNRNSAQSEIDQFLRQAKQQMGGVQEVDEIDDVVVIAPPKRRNPPQQPKSKQEIWQEQTGQAVTPKPAKQRQQRATAKRRTSPQQSPPTPAPVQQSPVRPVSQPGQEGSLTGSGTLTGYTMSPGTGPAAVGQAPVLLNSATEIRRLLQSRGGARNAIVLGEILARPKSLQSLPRSVKS